MGKSTINGVFSTAMLVYQRVPKKKSTTLIGQNKFEATPFPDKPKFEQPEMQTQHELPSY
jgi:hypothetical protein